MGTPPPGENAPDMERDESESDLSAKISQESLEDKKQRRRFMEISFHLVSAMSLASLIALFLWAFCQGASKSPEIWITGAVIFGSLSISFGFILIRTAFLSQDRKKAAGTDSLGAIPSTPTSACVETMLRATLDAATECLDRLKSSK